MTKTERLEAHKRKMVRKAQRREASYLELSKPIPEGTLYRNLTKRQQMIHAATLASVDACPWTARQYNRSQEMARRVRQMEARHGR